MVGPRDNGARMPGATILFVGDVCAGPGRRALRALLPGLRDETGATFVVVNGENAAGGIGITPDTADELFAAGADVITLGNHAYRHREIYRYLDEREHIVRPANYLASQPGRGTTLVERDGVRLGVANLSGNVFMQAGRPAFPEADAAVGDLRRRGAHHVLLDFHAEATSEKVAMGWHLDGRATAVVGTHTHVPTADARVLPGGTAHITDVGMTGAREGVIGMRREGALEGFRTHMPIRHQPAEGDPWLMGVVIRCSERALRAEAIEAVLRPLR